MRLQKLLTLTLFWLSLSLSLAHAGAPRVSLPNGELTLSNTDISVKVLGGQVAVARTWTNGRWYLNTAWAPLKFKLDTATNAVKYVDRAGSVYERAGNGDVYMFDYAYFIRREAGGWRWYDRYGNGARYDGDGRLLSYFNRNQVSTSFVYANNVLAAVKDHFGTTILSFEYVGAVLRTVRDYSGRSVTYTTTAEGLTEVTDATGYTWRYRYDSNGQLTKVTDPELNVTEVIYAASYSAAGVAAPQGISFSGRPGRDFRISRVALLKDALLRETRYSYDYARTRQLFTVVTTSPAPISRVTESIYDLEGRLVKSLNGTRQEYERRRDGPLIDYVKDERGLITRTERDSYRNVVLIEHPDGGVERWDYQAGTSFITEYTDEAQVKSTYAYDSRGNLTKTTQAVGTQNPPLERVIEMRYDSVGRMTGRTQKGATVADDAVTTYEYDNYGNVTKITDAENQVTEMTYNVLGNVLTRKDARLHTSTMTYTPGGWQETSTTNLGFVSRMTYDKTGNRESSLTPIDGAATATTFYRYDDLDRLRETQDPLGGLSKQRYDEEGRMFESEDARQVLTKLEYDGTSRMIKMIDGNQNATETVYGDAVNALEGLVAKRIYPTYSEAYKYDQRDRQVEVTQILSPTKSYVSRMVYDGVGQVISQTDAKGRTSQRFYDKLRRLTKEIDPILGETTYTYDVRDNLLSVTDANGHTHTFTYDKVNRKKTEARPLGQTIRYQYDPNGNLIERLSPNGAKRKFTYDHDNRLELEQHFMPKTTVPSKTMSYSYDQRGLLKTYSDGLTSGVYIYDAKGQKTSEAITFGTGPSAFTKTITRTYEANGLLKSMTYPGTTGTLNYTYDTNNQLKTYKIPGLAANNDTLTYQYRWNAIKEITMPGNLKRVVTLDALQRPERIEVKVYGATPGNNGQPVMDHKYIYDEVSNISKKTTLDGDYVYGYDRLDRLTDAAPPAGLQASSSNSSGLPIERYSYDNVHNRLTSLHQPGPWIYNENNELKAWGSAATKHAITYDLNGSTIKDEIGAPVVSKTTEYVYDAQDRMIEVKDNLATVAKYAYDPMGRRIWRQAGGDNTWFLYSDEGLIEELTAANTSIRTYGWNPGGMWGTDTIWQKDANGVFMSNNDHLYTTDVLTGAVNGNKGWAGIRESFGKTTVQAGSATSYLMRFPGQWEDGVGGFSQNWWREYKFSTSTYLESDPIALRGGVNYFSYVLGNPVSGIDPRGLISWDGVFVLGGLNLSIPPIAGVGGDYLRFHLISECVNNRKAVIVVDAGGVALNVGFAVPFVGAGLSTVSVDDHLSYLDPYIMQRIFSMDTFGTFAYSWLCIAQLGGADANCAGWAFSTDILNLTAITGTSVVKSVKYESCCE